MIKVLFICHGSTTGSQDLSALVGQSVAFGTVGFITVGGGPLFFDTADRGAIGDWGIQFAEKYRGYAK